MKTWTISSLARTLGVSRQSLHQRIETRLHRGFQFSQPYCDYGRLIESDRQLLAQKLPMGRPKGKEAKEK